MRFQFHPGTLFVLVTIAVASATGLAAVSCAESPRDAKAAEQESESAVLQSLLPRDGIPQDQVEEAAESLADEGDRLANLGKYREAVDYYTSALMLTPHD